MLVVEGSIGAGAGGAGGGGGGGMDDELGAGQSAQECVVSGIG